VSENIPYVRFNPPLQWQSLTVATSLNTNTKEATKARNGICSHTIGQIAAANANIATWQRIRVLSWSLMKRINSLYANNFSQSIGCSCSI